MSLYILLKKERETLKTRIDAIDLLLETYKETTVSNHNIIEAPIMEDYDLIKQLKKASTPNKFLLVLKNNQRFMKIREIAKILVVQLGGTEDDWTVKLSRTTGKLKEQKKIVSHQVGSSNTGYYWGSPDWKDANNNIKKGFEFIEDDLGYKNLDLFKI